MTTTIKYYNLRIIKKIKFMLKLSNLVLLLFLTSVAFGQEIDHPSKKYSEDSEIEVENFLIKTKEQDNVAIFC